MNDRFCWMDLAATDADRARDFYAGLFGWTARDQRANGGRFVRLRAAGQEIGSLYQIQGRDLALGAASHWTPYVQVARLEDAAAKATALGGQVLVAPFEVEGMARIALIKDPVGAQVGLWERPAALG